MTAVTTLAGDTAAIRCRDVRRSFGPVRAVDGVDLEVGGDEIVALLGPSGCGKTTLLRLVAGFDRPDAGSIEVSGTTVAGPGRHVPPERRRIGMVFQDYALFPHLDVAANVGYGLGRRPDRSRVAEMLELVGLDGLAGRRPDELSGGQQQRVALARALAPGPGVVLLDEPFSNLDAALRVRLRGEVRRILGAAGVSGLLVTHDQAEALSVADRVAVVRDGAVAQIGAPEEVYGRPASRWVAGFLGEVDLLPGDAEDGRATTALGAVGCDPGLSGPVDVLVRPHHVTVTGARASGAGVPATVEDRAFHGPEVLVGLRLADGTALRHRGPGDAPWRPGDAVHVALSGTPTVLPPEDGEDRPARGPAAP